MKNLIYQFLILFGLTVASAEVVKARPHLLSCNILLASSSSQGLTPQKALGYYQRAWNLFKEDETVITSDLSELRTEVIRSLEGDSLSLDQKLEALFFRSKKLVGLISYYPQYSVLFEHLYTEMLSKRSRGEQEELTTSLVHWVVSQHSQTQSEAKTRETQVRDRENLTSFVKTLKHSEKITSTNWAPDGSKVVTASEDGTARIWDAHTGERVSLLKGHAHWIHSVQFFSDGSKVVTASGDGTAKVWDVETGEELSKLTENSRNIRSIQMSSDASMMLAKFAQEAKIWNLEAGVLMSALAHTADIRFALFAPDSLRVITTAFKDKAVHVWDPSTGKQLNELVHTDVVSSAQFSPDSSMIVTLSENGPVTVWDANSGKKKTKLRLRDKVSSIQFSPNSAMIVTTSDEDETVRVWNANTGALVKKFVHSDFVRFAQFSPDSSMIVTFSESDIEDETVRVWSVPTGKEIVTLPDDIDLIVNPQFFPSETMNVITVEEENVRIWDVNTGREVARFDPDAFILSTQLSIDQTKMLIKLEDHTVRTWNLKSLIDEGLL